MADERDVRAAGAGVVANVCTGAAAAGAVENTCWPVADVTVPPVERGLTLARGLLLAAGVRAADGRLGAEVVRSAEAGAWLRATLGDRNVGDGALWLDCAGGVAVAAGGVLCADGAGVAACGAATLNAAGANPPVGREAEIV